MANGTCRHDRQSIPDASKRLDTWPTVDTSALPAARRKTYNQRCQAVTLYLTVPELSVSSITTQTGVDRKTLLRLLDRCMAAHPDGRVYGFRGAIPGLHVKPYERFEPVKFGRTTGKAGAFRQLLQRYPDIAAYLRRAFIERNRPIKSEREVRKGMRSIHQKFLKMCRDYGIHADQYPFTESRMGIRSLYAHFKSLAEESFEMSVKHAGGLSARAAPTSSSPAPAATRAYEVVEFDGHKIDLRLIVRLKDLGGEEKRIEMHRIWLLVVLDVATRCVLGYHLALSVEYSKADLACALQAALKPFHPRSYQIPTLAVRAGGGFPAKHIAGLEYACWDWFRCDNAKAHLAPDTIERLTQIVGCWTDVGAPAQPNDRPHIERFFHLVSRHFAHQLAGLIALRCGCGSVSTPGTLCEHFSCTGEDDGAFGIDQELAVAVDVYRALRRRFWSELKTHRQCVRSACHQLWRDMRGQKTVVFCPKAATYMRWRMLWEGCGAPRYLRTRRQAAYYGISGWLHARPAPYPDDWTPERKTWMLSHIFANACLASHDTIERTIDENRDTMCWEGSIESPFVSTHWALSDPSSVRSTILFIPIRHRKATAVPNDLARRAHREWHVGQVRQIAT